jgi:LmbE family N-acetylglucosaminyl deacetylase
MQQFYDAIYLSPHLDDVALSCGGQIFQKTRTGQRVLIVTITAGDPPQTAVSNYAQSLHDRWDLVTDAVAARRAEDLVANKILGAETLHWSLPDCIYRSHPETGAPLYLSDPDIFGDVHPAERPLVVDLSEQMAALPSHQQLYVPLTIGHHVDHQLTRAAAE